jgi:hypothetical protein
LLARFWSRVSAIRASARPNHPRLFFPRFGSYDQRSPAEDNCSISILLFAQNGHSCLRRTGPPAFIIPYPASGNPFHTVSAPNYFAVGDTAWSLSFASPLDSLSFTVPGTDISSTMAAWTATVYSATNVQLDQVGNPNVTFPSSSVLTYTLTGPDIAYVGFSEDGHGFAGNFLAYDDLTLPQTPLPAALSLFQAASA